MRKYTYLVISLILSFELKHLRAFPVELQALLSLKHIKGIWGFSNFPLYVTLHFHWQDEARSSPPPFRAAPVQAQNIQTRDKELSQRPAARLLQPSSSVPLPGPTRLLQECFHKSLKSFPSSQQPFSTSAQHTCAATKHHTSLSTLQHTCQSTPHLSGSEQYTHSHFTQHTGHFNRLTSGHQTCPGFLHHRDSSIFVQPEAAVKLSSRSSSYEKSSVFSKSASSSKEASPMPSPHPSPRPSPCPSPCPSHMIPASLSCSPDRPCSPALTHKIIVTDMNRLSADSRQQQRGMSPVLGWVHLLNSIQSIYIIAGNNKCCFEQVNNQIKMHKDRFKFD